VAEPQRYLHGVEGHLKAAGSSRWPIAPRGACGYPFAWRDVLPVGVGSAGHQIRSGRVAAVCRLFGLSAGSERIRATFWLLEAPDSLAAQSRREPDGTGLGTFDADGAPRADKAPIAAYQDQCFAQEAKERLSSTFIAHIRYASTGGLSPENTHPFQEHGRIFAHNGVIADLPRLETELGEYLSLVRGDTDSERSRP